VAETVDEELRMGYEWAERNVRAADLEEVVESVEELVVGNVVESEVAGNAAKTGGFGQQEADQRRGAAQEEAAG